MRKIGLFIGLLPHLAWAQDSLSIGSDWRAEPVVYQPRAVLKVAPLSLVDIDATVQGAIEIPLTSRVSIQPEVGFGGPKLNPVWWNKPDLQQPQSTFRARTEIRYYVGPTLAEQVRSRSKLTGVYVSGEALFKQMTRKYPRPLSGTSPVPSPVITPNPAAKVVRNVHGLHAKVGYQGVPFKRNPSFVVDVYMGVGFRIISVRQTSGVPVSEAQLSRFVPTDGVLRKPSLAGGVKLGWVISTPKKVKKK